MSRFDLFFVVLDECNEIVDSGIAKRIIDLHCDNLNDLQIIYKQEEIIRYINFAKHFKPVLNQVGYIVHSARVWNKSLMCHNDFIG